MVIHSATWFAVPDESDIILEMCYKNCLQATLLNNRDSVNRKFVFRESRMTNYTPQLLIFVLQHLFTGILLHWNRITL